MDLSHADSVAGSAVYMALPPQYPPIIGKLAAAAGVTHNLMSHFVSMENGEEGQSSTAYGKVFSDTAFFDLQWAGEPTSHANEE